MLLVSRRLAAIASSALIQYCLLANILVSLLLPSLLFLGGRVECSVEEEKLIKNLFKGYNKLIRPVRNSSEKVVITMDLVLLQLINVYEKEQIMKTNVWINLKWHDFQLQWNINTSLVKSKDVKSIRVPFDKVWTPDIVLFNNADGNYEASYKPNVVVYGEESQNILWIPPAIYKSSCTIDVRYFPFDEQSCEMRFGSWTFDANQVHIKAEKPQVNLEDYLPSGTWDVISAPSSETLSNENNRMELVYKFRIRRKTLFYTVNLIIPTVLISFLSIFVFYLPTDEGEKMTLCISILLALVVFLLLVSKILPPTSMVIPLISKYLIFTLMMNIVTILNTVIIINWNYRTPRTHKMPKWVKIVFITFLPKVLFMQRPNADKKSKTNPSEQSANSLSITSSGSDQDYDACTDLDNPNESKNMYIGVNGADYSNYTSNSLSRTSPKKSNGGVIEAVGAEEFLVTPKSRQRAAASLRRQGAGGGHSAAASSSLPRQHSFKKNFSLEMDDQTDWTNHNTMTMVNEDERVAMGGKKKIARNKVGINNKGGNLNSSSSNLHNNPYAENNHDFGAMSSQNSTLNRCSTILPEAKTNSKTEYNNNKRPKQQQHKNLDKFVNSSLKRGGPVMLGAAAHPAAQLNNNNIIQKQNYKKIVAQQQKQLLMIKKRIDQQQNPQQLTKKKSLNELRPNEDYNYYYDDDDEPMNDSMEEEESPTRRSAQARKRRNRMKTLSGNDALLNAATGENMMMLPASHLYQVPHHRLNQSPRSNNQQQRRYSPSHQITQPVHRSLSHHYRYRNQNEYGMENDIDPSYLHADVRNRAAAAGLANGRSRVSKNVSISNSNLNQTAVDQDDEWTPMMSASRKATTNRKRQKFRQMQTQSLEYDSNAYNTSADEDNRPFEFSPEILETADKITFITNHIKSENDYEEIRDDWKYVALVIDRLQLYTFFLVTVFGTAYILFDAPHIFQFVDQQAILKNLIEVNKAASSK